MELNYQIYVGTLLLICWCDVACVGGMFSILRDIIRAVLACISTLIRQYPFQNDILRYVYFSWQCLGHNTVGDL